MYYDKNYISIRFNKDNWLLLKFHKKYNISNTIVFDSKLSQQYTESFYIFEKVNNLTNRLNILQHWRIHSIFSMTQFEFTETFNKNLFKRTSLSSNFVFVENDTKTVKFYEILKILMKRTTKKRKIEYLIK